MIVPVWMIFASSTHTSSVINIGGLQMFLGESFYDNYLRVLLYKGGFFKEITALKMFFNSFIMATGVAILSVVTSLMAAYALVYYRIKYASFLFWIIFITILVPLELRIFPTYSVMAELNLVNSYFGLIVPISASAIATFIPNHFQTYTPITVGRTVSGFPRKSIGAEVKLVDIKNLLAGPLKGLNTKVITIPMIAIAVTTGIKITVRKKGASFKT